MTLALCPFFVWWLSGKEPNGHFLFISSAKEKETKHFDQIKVLEKNEFRLKTISKADETKQELETQLETLKSEEQGKLYQVKNYQQKAEKMDEEEANLKEAISNLQVLTIPQYAGMIE